MQLIAGSTVVAFDPPAAWCNERRRHFRACRRHRGGRLIAALVIVIGLGGAAARVIGDPASGSRSAYEPLPPWSALIRQGVEPIRQGRKGGNRLLVPRPLARQVGSMLGLALGELGDHPLGLRPLGGQAGGICGIIRNHIVRLLVDPRFSGGELRF
jgi:hypothetical protein